MIVSWLGRGTRKTTKMRTPTQVDWSRVTMQSSMSDPVESREQPRLVRQVLNERCHGSCEVTIANKRQTRDECCDVAGVKIC